MTPAQGGLSYLAIGTIFLVVIGTMWAGIQYSEGALVDREPPSELETQLRGAVWEAFTGESGTSGSDTSVRVTAQQTAETVADGGYFANGTSVGLDAEASESLARTKGLCARVPVKLVVADPAWNASGSTVPQPVARDVGERAAELLRRYEGSVVVSGEDRYQHGVGVAVDGSAVFVVYRTCNLGY